MRRVFLSLSLLLVSAVACFGGGGGSAYPPAGRDRYDSVRATLEITFDQEDVVSIDLEGSAVVARGEPDQRPDGTDFVPMIMTDLDLSGEAEGAPVTVTLRDDLRSAGETREQEGETFPAESFFSLYLQIDLQARDLLIMNSNQLPVLAEVDSLPPGQNERYELPENFAVPLHDDANQQIGAITGFTLTLGRATTSEPKTSLADE